MSTCHQAHNIPWNTLLQVLHKTPISNTSYHYLEGDFENFTLVFTPDEDGKVYKKIKYFSSKFELAIREFSQTERKKYKNEDIDKITKLYEDELKNEWLDQALQDISEWDKFKTGCGNCRQSWCSQQYLEPVKELFIQEKAASLLALARRGFPFEKLLWVTYSNFFHYGISRIKEDCLTLYIHLNLLLATGTLCEPSQWNSQWRLFLDREILTRYDGNSQARMYKEYFQNNPKFEDLDGLQSLLKKLFRVLYLYDMIMNEKGIVKSWEQEVLDCVESYFMDRTNRRYFPSWCKQREGEGETH